MLPFRCQASRPATLIGQGDALLLTADASAARRLQAALVTEDEIKAIVAHCKRQPAPAEQATLSPAAPSAEEIGDDLDLLIQAAELITDTRFGSVAMLQRKLRINVARANTLLDHLERLGVVLIQAVAETLEDQKLGDKKAATAEPYASAKRVFRAVDNGSSHRGKAAVDRLPVRFPNAVMVHTPVHASWLNQVEIFFSIVQRTVVTPNDFTSLDQVEDLLIAFERRYNETARPFRWKFTPADLEDLMARIERHEQKEFNSQQHDNCEHQPAALNVAA